MQPPRDDQSVARGMQVLLTIVTIGLGTGAGLILGHMGRMLYMQWTDHIGYSFIVPPIEAGTVPGATTGAVAGLVFSWAVARRIRRQQEAGRPLQSRLIRMATLYGIVVALGSSIATHLFIADIWYAATGTYELGAQVGGAVFAIVAGAILGAFLGLCWWVVLPEPVYMRMRRVVR